MVPRSTSPNLRSYMSAERKYETHVKFETTRKSEC